VIVRMYTGQDGQTHFEDLHLPAAEVQNVAIQAGANIVFRRFPADYFSDWHTAPRRQYIFVMSGHSRTPHRRAHSALSTELYAGLGRCTAIAPPVWRGKSLAIFLGLKRVYLRKDG